jgi:3-deoxy-7-phosphoheptulonate synthase
MRLAGNERGSLAQSARERDALTGLMIESHLHEGRQDIVPGQALQQGVSVTDACIGFEQTVPVLAELANAVRARRGG